MPTELTSLLKEPEIGEGPRRLAYPDLLRDLSRQVLEGCPRYDYRGKSADEVRARLAKVRRTLKRRLGLSLGVLPPEPTAVAERPAVQYDGFSIRPVVIQRGSDWHITAHLYVPDGLEKPAPAVLHVHGHSYEGKSTPFYARRCRGLARRGFVVLFVDFPEAGERKGTGHALWYPVLARMTVQGIMVEDNRAALSYLAGLDFVDARRIGVTGSSGGGNQTTFLSALDTRVAASAPCNAPTMISDHCNFGSGAYCHCEAVPGLVGAGIEYHDLLAAAAPRGVRVFAGVRDPLFPIVGARHAVEQAAAAHAALGSKLGCTLEEHYCGHECPADFRQGVYRFFETALKRRGDLPGHEDEGEEVDMNDPQLRALPERPAKSHTIADLFRMKLYAVEPRRPSPGDINRLLGRRPEAAQARVLVRIENAYWSRVLLETGDGAVLPTLVRKAGNGPMHLVIADGGKQQALKRFGGRRPAAALDWRGQGETAPPKDEWYQRAVHYTCTGGEPLVGGRVNDIIAAAAWLREEGYRLGKLVAYGGEASLIALLAALVDAELPPVEVHGLLRTFQDAPGLVGQVHYTAWVPGLAALTDIPQMLDALGERVTVKRWLTPGAEPPREGYT